MNYDLPKALTVGGVKYPIRWDYRAALDIFAAFNDPEIGDEEKIYTMLFILFPDFEVMPPEDIKEAAEKARWFLDGGEEEPENKKSPRLVDWEQDFTLISAPVNRILGKDIRAGRKLHWWSFLAAFYEIGDCTFAYVVRLRDMRARGKALSKEDRQWYNKNRHLVDFKTRYTTAEDDMLKQWGMK